MEGWVGWKGMEGKGHESIFSAFLVNDLQQLISLHFIKSLFSPTDCILSTFRVTLISK